MEKRKVSTFIANEEKKRLLKSGKDNAVAFSLKRHRVFFKDGDVFKKDGGLFLFTPFPNKFLCFLFTLQKKENL